MYALTPAETETFMNELSNLILLCTTSLLVTYANYRYLHVLFSVCQSTLCAVLFVCCAHRTLSENLVIAQIAVIKKTKKLPNRILKGILEELGIWTLSVI